MTCTLFGTAQAAEGDVSPSVRFGALAQVDYTVWRQSSADQIDWATGATENTERIYLRRGRVWVMGDYGMLNGMIAIEASTISSISVRPFEAYISLRLPPDHTPFTDMGVRLTPYDPDPKDRDRLRGQITMGLIRIPFGFDCQEKEIRSPFLERTTATSAFFPGGHDFGVGADVAYRWLRASIAMMNGNPSGEATWGELGETSDKDIVGRFGVNIEFQPAITIEAGFSGLSGVGFSPGTAPTKNAVVWTDNNNDGIVQLTELVGVPGNAGSAPQKFSRAALGVDAMFGAQIAKLGWLKIGGELTWAKNLDRFVEPADPIGSGRTMRELGYSLRASQDITDYAQIAIRYDSYDADFDARESIAGNVISQSRLYSTLAISAIARIPHGRLLVEYDMRRNPLGIATSGMSTTLPDDSFTLRAEALF